MLSRASLVRIALWALYWAWVEHSGIGFWWGLLGLFIVLLLVGWARQP